MNKRLIVLLFALLLPAQGAAANDECMYRPDLFQQAGQEKTLKRGVNLSGWWWDDYRNDFTREDFQRIRKLGFDFVRLPVSQHMLAIEDKDAQEKKITELRCDIVDLLKSGLNVVLDFHPSKDFKEITETESSDLLLVRLENYWKTLRPAIIGLPEDRIYLNLFNEPSRKIHNWWGLQADLISRLRPLYPEYTFIVSDRMNMFEELEKKKPYVDQNIIYDFHFYKPFFFTHHNAHWVNPPPDIREKTDRILYPSLLEKNDPPNYDKMQKYIDEGWNKEKLSGLLESVITWSRRTKTKLICLEFGVYRPFVGTDSRIRWLKDVREILEANNIPWAIWSYNGNFGLFDKQGFLDTNAAIALGLNLTD